MRAGPGLPAPARPGGQAPQLRPVEKPAETIPLMRPSLPTVDRLLPYLEQIDANRWYTNAGPLEAEFRHRLAGLMGRVESDIVPVSSGTMALQIALRAEALTGRRKCLMPAWTFAATPLAAMGAGLEPHFVDVDAASWTLSPEEILGRDDLGDVAAIVVVAPFGAPPDLHAWARVMTTTGIPVVVDAAASFDAVARLPADAGSHLPLIVSLHATKSLGIGEGGLIVSGDPARTARYNRYRNFGFEQMAVSTVAGTNAKLSEYHAAVGLAALDDWPRKREQFLMVRQRYGDNLEAVTGVDLMPGSSSAWIAGSLNVVTPRPAEEIISLLADSGIEARRWWGSGCHTHPAFDDVPRDPLPLTDDLASRVVGVPLSVDMRLTEVDRVCDALASICARQAAAHSAPLHVK